MATMTTTMMKSLGAALVLSLFATACFDGSGSGPAAAPDDGAELAFVDEADAGTPDDSVPGEANPEPEAADPVQENIDPVDPVGAVGPEASTGPDRPCAGGAFPDDDEFRELLCAVQWAQLDLVSAGGVLDPAWVARSSDAIILYGADRAAAISELEAVLDELTTATPEQADVAAPEADADDVTQISAATAGAQACMVEVDQLIMDAKVAG
ncbi:MAG: hypothetical protein ACC660_05885, partial [Acidimicrobiales bacterium]